MEDYLTCKLCKNFYKEAIILPCTHCFCRACLLKHSELTETAPTSFDASNNWLSQKNESVNKFQCPECLCSINKGLDALPRFNLIDPIVDKLTQSKNVSLIECDFCEDYSKQPATLKCVQCNYTYCGNCFDTYHISRGPLAKHEIVDPLQEDNDQIIHLCVRHDSEKKKIFCETCGVCICFLCKEIGQHVGHSTQIVDAYQENERQSISDELDGLMSLNSDVITTLRESDEFSLIVKKTGLETEGHVIRECDHLISIIEAQKEYLLEIISSEFNKTIDNVSGCNDNLIVAQQKLNAVAEMLNHALESHDDNAILEAASLLKNRSDVARKSVNVCINTLKDYFNFNPFNGMILDFYQQKKDLENINWLKPPPSPKFKREKCFAKNNTAYLSWESVKGRITNYYLEKSFIDGDFEIVYEGKDYRNIPVHMEYNEVASFRVCAANGAGKGLFGDKIVLEAPHGINFYIDKQRTSESVQVIDDGCTIICNAMDYGNQYVVGDVELDSGIHFWKIIVNKMTIDKSARARISFGIASDVEDDESSYALIINLGTKEKEKHERNEIGIHRKSSDICHQSLTFHLNFQKQIFDIFANGVLILKDANHTYTFEDFGNHVYRPFFKMEGCNVTMSIIDDIAEPVFVPEKPRFKKSRCYADNMDILFEWHDDTINTDAYILKLSNNPYEDNSKTVYRGNKCNFVYEAESYEQTIYARIFAINTLGQSEGSDLLELKTASGIGFSIQNNSSSNLQLWSKNRSVKYSSEYPLILFGDVVLERGLHFWKITIEQFEGKDARLGVGVSMGKVNYNEFGLKESFGMIIGTSDIEENPVNIVSVVLKKKSLLQSDFGFLMDVNKQRFYCYLNGMLLVKNKWPIFTKSLSTFSNVPSGLLPAFTVCGNLKFSLICDQSLPLQPATPLFGDCYCEIITCHFAWKPSNTEGSYTNFFILKVAVTDLAKSKGRADENFKEIYKGNSQSYIMKQVSYNSKIVAMVTAVNLSGESKDSDKVVLFTAKGFLFHFNEQMKSGEIKLSNNGKTASLSSLVHSFVLGNRVITQGLHSWQIRIDNVEEQNKMSVIGIGISKSKLNDPILGEDQFSFGVQIIQHPKVNIRHTKYRHQLQMSAEEACNADFLVEVNLEEKWMNVFLNGSQLRSDPSSIGKPTFSDVRGEFYPAISLYGSKIQVSIGNKMIN